MKLSTITAANGKLLRSTPRPSPFVHAGPLCLGLEARLPLIVSSKRRESRCLVGFDPFNGRNGCPWDDNIYLSKGSGGKWRAFPSAGATRLMEEVIDREGVASLTSAHSAARNLAVPNLTRDHVRNETKERQKPPLPDLPIYVDASDVGIALVVGERWRAWQLLPGWKSDGRDNNWAEIIAVEMAVRTLVRQRAKDTTFCIRSDNLGVVGSLSAGHSRDPHQNSSICRISLLRDESNLELKISWVPSNCNLADRLSRTLSGPKNMLLPSPRIPLPLAPFISASHQ